MTAKIVITVLTMNTHSRSCNSTMIIIIIIIQQVSKKIQGYLPKMRKKINKAVWRRVSLLFRFQRKEACIPHKPAPHTDTFLFSCAISAAGEGRLI